MKNYCIVLTSFLEKKNERIFVDPKRLEGNFFLDHSTVIIDKHRFFEDKRKAEYKLFMYMILTCESPEKTCKNFLVRCYMKGQNKRSFNITNKKLAEDRDDNCMIKLLDGKQKQLALMFRLSKTCFSIYPCYDTVDKDCSHDGFLSKKNVTLGWHIYES